MSYIKELTLSISMQLLSRDRKSVLHGGEFSKARIASLVLVVGGLLTIAGQVMNGDYDLATAYTNAQPLILGVLGYGLRDAVGN